MSSTQWNREIQRYIVASISEKWCFSALEDQATSEERLEEHTTEQPPWSQQDEDGEDKDEIETTSGENKGTNRYHRQKKESLQRWEVGDETIDTAPISQGRHHGVEPYHEDDEDGEDEDARPPSRRKRGLMSSEALARKKVRTSSATRDSMASRSSSSGRESILGTDYQEWPLQGFLKRTRIGREITYCWNESNKNECDWLIEWNYLVY